MDSCWDFFMDLSIKRLHPDAILPAYSKPGDSGFDLYCVEDVSIKPGASAILPTGLAMAVPDGFELQIRMRSGSSLRTPLMIANAPGTIDSGYRGEIGIIVRNIGASSWLVHKGERIAQGVIAPVVRASFKEVATLPDSIRGSHGFGSTGVD